MRVLIIDDSRAMRVIIGKILKEIGLEVFEAGDGREALERLKQLGKPDLRRPPHPSTLLRGEGISAKVFAKRLKLGSVGQALHNQVLESLW